MKNKDFHAIVIAFCIFITLWLLICFGLTHLAFYLFPGITWGFWKLFLAIVVGSFILNTIGK